MLIGLSRSFLDFLLVQKKTDQSKVWEKLSPAVPSCNSLKVLSLAILRFYLLDWNRKDYCDIYERDTRVSQNSRYNKEIDLDKLEALAKTPPELRFLLLLCAGFDLHRRTSVKISNLEGRLRTISSKLKNVNQPELREVLKKLASDDSFSTELIDLIKERMDERARSELKDMDLLKVPSEGATPTNLGKNAGVGQSNLSSFSISSDDGGGATCRPADRSQLENFVSSRLKQLKWRLKLT